MKTHLLTTAAALLSLLLLSSSSSLAQNVKAKFRFEDEWGSWKLTHDRNYTSEMEELERHLVWLSNKVYIDQHNANARIFGYTLAMNRLGDLVGKLATIYLLQYFC